MPKVMDLTKYKHCLPLPFEDTEEFDELIVNKKHLKLNLHDLNIKTDKLTIKYDYSYFDRFFIFKLYREFLFSKSISKFIYNHFYYNTYNVYFFMKRIEDKFVLSVGSEKVIDDVHKILGVDHTYDFSIVK